MADAKAAAKTDAAPVEGEKKKRKSSGPRQPRSMFALLTIVEGKPAVEVASYNAATLLKTFTEAANTGKSLVLVEITPTK